MYLSVVLPVRNEEKNLPELHERLIKVCSSLNKEYEIIYVENGSTDSTLDVLKSLKDAKVIVLRWHNFMKSGQTAALDAGIKAAKGELIVTMDSDLQNMPEDIPKLIEKLESEDLDVVSGWRNKRKDSFFITNLSKFGSRLRKLIINPGIHDLGCTLKVYRRECFDGVDLYGEMHRYIVAVLRWKGFNVDELEVQHHPRKHGKSHYNWKKMFRGFVDMLMVWFLKKYSDRPLHLFGVSGILLTLTGIGFLMFLGILRLFGVIALADSIWPLLSVLAILVGMQLFIFGIVIELLVRSYFSLGREMSYSIKKTINL